MKPLVYVTRRIPDNALEMLEQIAELRVHQGELPPTREQLLSGVDGCAGILSLLSDRIDAAVMEAAGEQLRVISNFAVGFNNIDVLEAKRRGIAVGNTPDVLTDATADIAAGLLLSVARQFAVASRAARSGGWKTWEPMGWIGQDLKNKTIGIVGMGRIGSAVAHRLHRGWDMQVLYTATSPKTEEEAKYKARRVNLDQLLEESDFVSLHVPLTPSTRHLIGSAEFRKMKRSAILINTSRGEIVDQEALVQALSESVIAGAGLDVCTPEPLPLDNPLFRLQNCVILPHIGSATIQTRWAMADRSARNMLAGLSGKPLPYPVP